MACKLVCLYQQKLPEIRDSMLQMTMSDDLLPAKVVNDHIGKATKQLAKFDLENFGKASSADDKMEESKDKEEEPVLIPQLDKVEIQKSDDVYQ